MKTTPAIASFLLCLSATHALAEEPSKAVHHATLGLAAAQGGFEGYASLCNLEARIRNVNIPRVRTPNANAGSARRNLGAQQRFDDIPPTQVFDNLWFLGTASTTTWLYGTPEGYILIDGLHTDEEAQQYVLDGMAAAGLDSSAIMAVLVTHGHGDHYGGADYLAEKLQVEILMTQEDWALVKTLGDHPRFGPPPQSGGVVRDGEVLEFGTSSMNIHITPGHTPGTVSPIFELFDGDSRHVAMLWGGTGFNFGPNVEIFKEYAASAAKMRAISEQAGVDVVLSGHPKRDGTVQRLDALETRLPGDQHPFVRGAAGHRIFDVLEHCALAQAERFIAEPAQ